MEFKNLEFVTQYEEFEQTKINTLTVILKRDDKHFIKLTNRASYKGSDKSDVNYFKNYGFWSLQNCNGNYFDFFI